MICRRAWGNDEKSVLLRLSSLKLPLKLWAKPFSIGLLGIPRFIISQVLRFSGSQALGHPGDAGGGAAITGIYDRNDYHKEKRRALDAWAVR